MLLALGFSGVVFAGDDMALPSFKMKDGSIISFTKTGTWSAKRGRKLLADDCGAAVWGKDDYRTQATAENIEITSTSLSSVRLKGTLSVEGISLNFEERVSHLNGGLVIDYIFTGKQLSELKSFSVVLNLPVRTYVGLPFVSAGKATGTFPIRPAKEPHLAMGASDRLIVATKKDVKLLVETGQPCTMVLQDTRKWQLPTYQLLVVPIPAKEDLARATFFVAFSGIEHGPRIVHLTQNRNDVGLYEPIELNLGFWGKYDNPYDPSEVDVNCRFYAPSGKTFDVDGFLYQKHIRMQVNIGKSSRELLQPAGHIWKVRFAPMETGTYTYALSIKTKNGNSMEERGFFTAKPSDNPGLLQVSRKDNRFFEFDNGEPFFGIGHNVCWADSTNRTLDFDRYFSKMQEAGENLSRVWFSSWDMQIEGEKLDAYRLDNAWRMDYVLDLAMKSGIYVQLCFDNFHDYRNEEAIKLNPYFKDNGGPISFSFEFFTNPEAKKHYKHRLRYTVSRWGHLPSVFAWELCNEIDYAAGGSPTALHDIVEWTREMSQYIREIDPYDHLITISTAERVWPELWDLPDIDFAQRHTYIHDSAESRDPAEDDASKLVAEVSDGIAHHGKPFFIGEFGYTSDGGTPSSLNNDDKFGIALHNAIWASTFSGAAATASNWWWDTYVHPNDLYYHYSALAKFVRDIDWTGGEWRIIREGEDSSVRIRGIANATEAYLWIQQPGNSWNELLVANQESQGLKDVTLQVTNLTSGVYRVEWWSTYSGVKITHSDRPTRGDVLTLNVPNVGPDVACKVLKVR